MAIRNVRILSRLRNSWPLLGFVLAGLLIAKGVVGLWTMTPRLDAAATTSSIGSSQHAFRPIERIRVGQRVVTNLPDGINDIDGKPFDQSLQEGATRVNPASWRLIRMRAEERWTDGTIDDINIETLQPVDWIGSHGVKVGKHSPIPLDLVEMGLPELLRANVIAIEPCPHVERGPGRVVLTTVNHLNPHVVELRLQSSRGIESSLRPTATHKFFSKTADCWLSAVDLKPGDELIGSSGRTVLVSQALVLGTHRVYNLTVEGDHVFRVGKDGTLVHNNGCTFNPNQPVSQWNYPSMGMDPSDVIAKAKVPAKTPQVPSPSPTKKKTPWNPHGPDPNAPFDGNVDNTY